MPKSAPAWTSLVSPPRSRWTGVPVMALWRVHQHISMAALAKLLPLKTRMRSLRSSAESYSPPTTWGPKNSATLWNTDAALSVR